MASYNDRIVARFLQATLVWGIFGLLTGLYTHVERLHEPANAGLAFLTFGRLQIVHNTLLIYAWAANGLFAGLYFALQRLCQTRIWSDRFAWLHYFGWQLVLIISVVSLSLGVIQGRPLADMEWPLDALMLLVWLLLLVNVFVTLRYRRVRYLSIPLWFLLAAVLVFPLIHTINAVGYPITLGKSYPLFPGLTDALLQAVFTQNLIHVLLILPFVGLLYYFLPKISGRPIHSYRLAALQFWTLLAVSAWLGPRALFYTPLPEWMQSIGAVAGILILAPSLGAVTNGFLTLGRRLERYRQQPLLWFFALACGFYALYALQFAFTSFKSIQLIVQYTDWSIAQNQLLIYGWVGSLLWGMAYFLVPKIWGNALEKPRLVLAHAILHGLGVLCLVLPMAMGGFAQGLMAFARHEDGVLIYQRFLFTFKFIRTTQTWEIVGYALLLIGLGLALFQFRQVTRGNGFQRERPAVEVEVAEDVRLLPLTLGILGVVVIAWLAELLPVILQHRQVAGIKPYSALALQGRDLYVREGCQSCHTQVVRWSLKEELRYGPASAGGEYQFQGPTLWSDKRNGPDLHRAGGRYPDLWHYQHLLNPRQHQPESTMPAYPWLLKKRLKNKLYPADTWLPEAKQIQARLAEGGVTIDPDVELIAMIAYIQALGIDAKR